MHTWKTVLERSQQGNHAPAKRLEKTPEQWRSQLPADVYAITRQSATERPFSSEMCARFEPGVYACACCGTPLFDASHKFDSGTGWPSFSSPIDDLAIAYRSDHSHGMERVETLCNSCDAHLGHVFPDGPAPSRLRYCINALALQKG